MSNLIEGLCKATTALRGWQTDKTNKEKGYDYISSNAVLSRAGGALAENGIMVFPQIKEHGYEVGSTASNKPRYDAWVLMDFVVTAEGGEQMVCPWVCRGTDYSAIDVAIYKAITSGHKYFLMKLLNIGVGNEDGEHDEPDPAPRQQAPRPQKSGLTYADGSPVADAGRDIFDKFKTAHGRIPASRDEMAAWYKAQKDGQAPTPPPTPEHGTAGDVDGVAPLLDGVHYQALLAKTDPNVGDVIAALNGDNVTTPPIARGIIEQLYAEIKPTPAKKLKPETAATMYEAVVTNLPLL